MQSKQITKEWYNKNEILEIYPIGTTTYKKRIRKLKCPEYINKTRIKCKKREIHFTALEELFGNNRKPNLKNVNNVIKWVKNQSWDWIGNIVPNKTHPSELKNKMQYFFNQLKRGKSGYITLFFSIEQNTNDDYYHCHFLIRDKSNSLSQKGIVELLEVITEKNTFDETRIHLKKYDFEKYGKRGSSYSAKVFLYGYGILN